MARVARCHVSLRWSLPEQQRDADGVMRPRPRLSPWAHTGLVVVGKHWHAGGPGKPRVLLRPVDGSEYYWLDRHGWEYLIDLAQYRPATGDELAEMFLATPMLSAPTQQG